MYIDLHCHILFDTDDGPADKNDMLRMLDASYNDGVREICVTPHFNQRFYGDNKNNADHAYIELVKEAAIKYPEMKFYRGNELLYHSSYLEHIREGKCSTINGTKYVLVDFSQSENKFNILSALKSLVSNGYLPILAHTERYLDLKLFDPCYAQIKELGAIMQVNAASIIGKNGAFQKWKARHLIKDGMCDIIASDAHNNTTRSTCINEAAKYIRSKYGNELTDLLTIENPRCILHGKHIK